METQDGKIMLRKLGREGALGCGGGGEMELQLDHGLILGPTHLPRWLGLLEVSSLH